jgi:8-oxo-dGTP pyrophosphatase MutT (NUDIX family)
MDMSALEPTLRPAARVLVIDAAGRVLLFRYREAGTGDAVWVTPGGGLGPGESHEDAALRELREEAGLMNVTLGPEIWLREHVFPWGGKAWRQQERFFLLRVDQWDVPSDVEAAHRTDGIDRHRWWTADELDQATENVAPRRLGSLLRSLLDEGPPTEPVDVGI